MGKESGIVSAACCGAIRRERQRGRDTMTKIYIDGSAGTTGLRIRERLAARRDIEILTLPDALRKDEEARRARMNESDITFFCLPDAAALEAEALVTEPHVRIIDTSTAHRTKPGWHYGFAELSRGHREGLLRAKRVSVPGCHASGFLALVYPLAAGGILPADYPLVCYSVTGYSGGGKKMIAAYQDPEREEELGSPRQYGVTQQHKHLKEMQAVPGLLREPIFAPVVADYYSGMVVSVPLYRHLLNGKQTPESLREYFRNYYEGQPLMYVADEVPSFIGANTLAGKDTMEILVSGSDERILLAARFDNLGKGASGAAIQCMNLMLGVPETTGLEM